MKAILDNTDQCRRVKPQDVFLSKTRYIWHYFVIESLLSALSISSEHIQQTRRSEHASGSHLQEVKGKLDNLQIIKPKSWFAFMSSGHS